MGNWSQEGDPGTGSQDSQEKGCVCTGASCIYVCLYAPMAYEKKQPTLFLTLNFVFKLSQW